MINKLKYSKILESLCIYYDLNQEEFLNKLKLKENKYLLLLILKTNNCFEGESIQEVFKLEKVKGINNSLKLAEKKLLINKEFREKYFELEENLEKMI